MVIELNILSERVEGERFVGTARFAPALIRRVEVLGLRNTAGEPERYVATLEGTYSNGELRAEVDVERTGGKLARLCRNRHRDRVSRVLSTLKPMLAEYKAANAALDKGLES